MCDPDEVRDEAAGIGPQDVSVAKRCSRTLSGTSVSISAAGTLGIWGSAERAAARSGLSGTSGE